MRRQRELRKLSRGGPKICNESEITMERYHKQEYVSTPKLGTITTKTTM